MLLVMFFVGLYRDMDGFDDLRARVSGFGFGGPVSRNSLLPSSPRVRSISNCQVAV